MAGAEARERNRAQCDTLLSPRGMPLQQRGGPSLHDLASSRTAASGFFLTGGSEFIAPLSPAHASLTRVCVFFLPEPTGKFLLPYGAPVSSLHSLHSPNNARLPPNHAINELFFAFKTVDSLPRHHENNTRNHFEPLASPHPGIHPKILFW